MLKKLKTIAIKSDRSDFYLSSIVFFRRHLKLHPDDNVARFRLAENLRAIGRVTDAKIELENLRNVPAEKAWFVHLSWGELYMNIGDFRRAELSFRKAVELNGNTTVTWVYLGACLAKQEKFMEACKVLQRGLKAQGDLDEVYLNLGYQKRAIGDYSGALKCFKKACTLDSNYHEAKLALRDVEYLQRMEKKYGIRINKRKK